MAERVHGTVLITGASRGLGAALAHAFSAAGAPVGICARGGPALDRVAEEVRRHGGRCFARAVDVADPDAVEGWVDEATADLGPPQVLVNNASLLGPRVPLAEYGVDEWRQVLEVNLTGTFVVTRAVLPRMVRQGSGSIINVSSGAAAPPRERWGAYAVSKQAVEGLTFNWAREMQGSGVRLNVVDPGAMRTGMRAAAYPDEDPATVKTPGELVSLFLWLAGEASAGVTGRRFQADEWIAARSGG